MPPEHRYSLPSESILRQYVVRSLLGHGGFGMTYLAEDTRLMRQVAIKELLPNDFATRGDDGTTVVARSSDQQANLEWARSRFIEEARTLAALHHPSILPVHDYFEENGTAYLVTSFIDGITLEDWLRKYGAPGEPELVSLTIDLLDALQLVHEHDFLHRDIKTENILIDRKSGKPMLIDFGNARVSTGQKTSAVTAVLTPGYAPFEQYSTKGRQGPWTDLYSLGAVLYRAITGAIPEDSAARATEDALVPLAEAELEGYSPEFLASIDRAMRLKPDQRWQSCQDWKNALLSPAVNTQEVVPVAEPEVAPAAPRPAGGSRRSAKPAVLLGALVVALAVGVFSFVRFSHGPGAGGLSTKDSVTRADDSSPPSSTIEAATKDQPFRNSIGMDFVPVDIIHEGKPSGKKILVSVSITRNRDFLRWKADHDARGGPDMPATDVSLYEDALAFCKWLSEKERRRYRLPSDHEWSCAAGLAEPEGRSVESWLSEKKPNIAARTPSTADAAASPPNGLGIRGLGLNVREWTSTLVGSRDPLGIQAVLRGQPLNEQSASQQMKASALAVRTSHDALTSAPDIGFRCVLEP